MSDNLPPGVTPGMVDAAGLHAAPVQRLGFYGYNPGSCWECGRPEDVHDDDWGHAYQLRLVLDLRCTCDHLRSRHRDEDEVELPAVPYCEGKEDGDDCPCWQYLAAVLPGADELSASPHGEAKGGGDLPF